MNAELKSKQGQHLGTVSAIVASETFSLDDVVKLTLDYQPSSQTQFPTVYRIESPGFNPDRVLVGSFSEQTTQEHYFKAGKFEKGRISAVFYQKNEEAGRIDIDFEKRDDGLYKMLGC